MGDRLKIFNVNSYSSFSFLRLVLRLSIFLYTFSLTLYSLIRVLYYFLYNSSSSLHFLKNYCLYFHYYCILYYYYYCRSLRFILNSHSFSILSFLSCLCLRLVFWKSIHLEVASDSFCLLINSSWLLVFILYLFFMILGGFNLYCWKGIHFSWSNSCVLLLLHIGLIFTFHFWFRDLLRELAKKYEILLIVLFLVFFLFLASEGLLFVSFFWATF